MATRTKTTTRKRTATRTAGNITAIREGVEYIDTHRCACVVCSRGRGETGTDAPLPSDMSATLRHAAAVLAEALPRYDAAFRLQDNDAARRILEVLGNSLWPVFAGCAVVPQTTAKQSTPF